MSLEIGIDISSQMSFRILTGMLLGPLDFLWTDWLKKNIISITVFKKIRKMVIRRWDS